MPAEPVLTTSSAAALACARDIAARSFANAASIDRDDGFPTEEIGLLARGGLLAAPLSRASGGLGLGTEPGGTRPLLQLLSTLGRGNLAVARLYEGHVNALQLIQAYGTPAQIAASALAARQDGKLFGVWNTWDVDAADGVQIAPAPAPTGYVLTGAKIFASGAGHVARALVTGSLPDGGWQLCLVPMDEVAAAIDPSPWHPIGMRASASYRVDFTGVTLADGALIGGPGDYFREPLFRGGAIRFAAAQLGGAQALLDQCRAYLGRAGRRDDPYLRERVGLAAVAVESCRLWLDSAADLTDAHPAGEGASPGPDERVAYADMTRTAVERACLDALELVERSVGARGLLRPSPIERIARDLRMYLRQAGPDAALARVGQAVLDSTAPVDSLWRLPAGPPGP